MAQIFTEPEMLGRNDAEHGRWEVEECMPRRGIPGTSITGRKMLVPTADTELSRCIRAHEMMHAKISPAGEWDEWKKRGIASEASLIASEELRVNYLCKKQGFAVDEHLTDEGETADGERMASTNDWAGAVRMAIATAGTASNKPFLNGVRRHNRLWGKALLDISKRAVKEMQKFDRSGRLASTSVHSQSGLAPYGFFYTELIAEWVDRLAGMEPPQEEEAQSEEPSQGMEGEGESKSGEGQHSNKGTTTTKPANLQKIKSVTPDSMRGGVPYWANLVVERMTMPVRTKGNLGKVKKASNVGKSPRRIHRYMTDPERRIFDNKKRGMGGVIVIDASGSMAFTKDDIRRIVEESPGATVVAYTDRDNGNGATNMWILADRGRMTDEMPDTGYGNGVDFPALEWAVKHRQHSTAPVVWVTDGGVCGPNQGFSRVLANQCTAYCKEKRIIVVPDVKEAVVALHHLRAGRPAKREWPHMLRASWEQAHSNPLENDEIR
jgi:hypothetical protein